MVYYMIRQPYSNELYHHGIKGQKWGVRRYQNPDGTLTAAGKRRYVSAARKVYRDFEKKASITGRVYEKTLKRSDKDLAKSAKVSTKYGFNSHEEYEKAVEEGRVSKRVQKKIDKADAKSIDSFERELVWSVENDRAKKVLNIYKEAMNETLKEYGKKPLKDIPTKTLKSGEDIVNGRILNAKDYAKSGAITGASIGAILAGAPFGIVSIPSASKKADVYQRRWEAEKGYYPYKRQTEYNKRKRQGYYK